MSFWSDALPYARQASTATNVLPSVILAQWADETGYRWPAPNNNPGNVGTYGSQVTSYPSVEAGVQGYTRTMLLPYYVGVRASLTWQAQCHALGESPWASSHYEASGPPPGEDTRENVNANNLTQYDGPQPPPITEENRDMITSLWDGTQRHVFVQNANGTVTHWWQQPNSPDTAWHKETLP